MSRVMTILTSRWFVTLIGVLLLAALVWFVGPLVAIAENRPLESETARLAVMLGLLAIWLLVLAISLLRARRSEQTLKEGIVAVEPTPSASVEEISLLKGRLQEALQLMRKVNGRERFGRRYLYQLPWYVWIGPPGAGKTTALVNSGLTFPLAERFGRAAVAGVGGTRNCDWWFTNEAVLLDTAGRYTTQDSSPTDDARVWTAFLAMLRKARPRQPINGVLVAIGLPDLLAQTPAERTAHAVAIRQRVAEITDTLKIRVPIYLMLTKCDLIAGFTDFYEDLGREEREQVWGMTFPPSTLDGKLPPVSLFAQEFGLLVARLNDRVLTRMHQEQDVERRSRIFGFPAQIAGIQPMIETFLADLFPESRFSTPPLLRGIYLTSGTQDGTPIDRLMTGMAATFGLPRPTHPALVSSGRSYFLTRLLRQVIFGEASLVAVNPRIERRRRWAYRLGAGAVALVLLGITGLWTYSYYGNRKLVAEAQAAAARYPETVKELDDRRVADGDLKKVLPALDLLRSMPAGYEDQMRPTPVVLSFGLYQGGKIGAQSMAAYRRALGALMLPRIVYRLEDQIRAGKDSPEFLFEALGVYLMLTGQAPTDPDLVRDWLTLDWSQLYPGERESRTREALRAHLDVLLSQPLPAVEADGALIADSRRQLSAYPLAKRGYALLRQRPEVAALPEWRPLDQGGPVTQRVFRRASGRSLTEGIPGLFTYAGFHKVAMVQLPAIVARLQGERWIVDGEAKPPAGAEAQLARDILALYQEEYVSRWMGLVTDLSLVPFENQEHAAEVISLLSGPVSPLRNLLTGIAQETRLTQAPEEPRTAASVDTKLAQERAAQLAAETAERRVRMLRLLRGTVSLSQQQRPDEDEPGRYVEERFRDLDALAVKGPDGRLPVDDLLNRMNDLYLALYRPRNPTERPATQLMAGPEAASLQALRAEAQRLPSPVGGMVNNVAMNVSQVGRQTTRSQIDAKWRAEILPLCQQALGGRYPFESGASVDVPLQDFTRLFAPGGLIDSFFNDNLAPFVDMSQRTWRWQRANDVDLGIPPAVLAQFQMARTIRDGFFGMGGQSPKVAFEMAPVSLDAGAGQVMVDVDGQQLSYAHGPVRPTSMQWPANGGASQARVNFSDPSGRTSSLSAAGPWAVFHLMDKGERAGAGSDRFQVTFRSGGRDATFEVRSASVLSPFNMPELSRFRCPPRL